MTNAVPVTTLVRTKDGRTLRVEEAGDLDGKPVLTHHGTPGAGHAYDRHVADATKKGIRLIAYDRPGYGGSTPHPNHTKADGAEDVRAIAQAIGIERLAVWGHSGGGPYALACAAMLPDLVVAVAALASIAPYGSLGLDYFDGMGAENVDDIRLTLSDEAAARRKLVEDRAHMLALTPEDLTSAFPTLLSAVDRAAQSPELTQWLWRCGHDGLAPGGEGWWDDGMAQLKPWGFSFESISLPVQLWHGRHDQFVPFQHGQWLADHIPGVDAHLSDADGHITLIQNRIPDVHAWLLEHF